MKVSTTPTGFVMAKAFTSADWDTTDFAIIRIATPSLLYFQKLMSDTSYVAKVDGFNYASFSGGNFSFHVSDETSEDIYQTLLTDDQWIFIDTTEDEIASLQKPQCQLTYHTLVIDRDLDIQFKCYGKHSDDTFWTSEMDITKWLSPTKITEG